MSSYAAPHPIKSEWDAARFDSAPRLIALLLCTVLVLFCVLSTARFEHWFVVPVLVCGGLLSWDAVKWFRGEADLFDPFALFSLLGLHLFFVAPLLHVATGYWLPYIDPPDDWRPWLGTMACLNVVGLGLYRLCRELLDANSTSFQPNAIWRLEPERFFRLTALALIVGAILQVLVYARFGGVQGYIAAFGSGADQFTGLGWLFMLSESVPIVALIGATVWLQSSPKHRTLLIAVGLLLGFVALKFFFGGLRGSRGHIIYGLYWAALVVHQKYHRLSRRLLLVGALLFFPFMYAYGFYKSFGVNALEALEGASARADLMDAAPRGMEAVLLGDLARSDVQAFMLYRISLNRSLAPYRFAWGETYLGSLAMLVPRTLCPDRPPTKVKFGTDLLFGPGAFETDIASTFAYGLPGEAMLNFGALGAVAAFLPLAIGVVVARRWCFDLHFDDSRSYVLPLLYSLPMMALLWDSDVLLFYVIKEGFVPAAIVGLSSRRSDSTPDQFSETPS